MAQWVKEVLEPTWRSRCDPVLCASAMLALGGDCSAPWKSVGQRACSMQHSCRNSTDLLSQVEGKSPLLKGVRWLSHVLHTMAHTRLQSDKHTNTHKLL